PPRDGAEPLVRGTTDIDGRCRLRAPASGAFLVVRDRGYGIGRLLLDEAPGAELQVTLWPLRRLAGVVRTTDGEVPPVPLRLRLCDRLSVWFADTDARGRFEVEVAADTVEVQCATPGWTTARSYRDPTTGRDMIGRREFPAGDDTNVYVAPYGATRLHVTDAVTGKPIEVIGLIATDDNGYPRRCGQFVAPGGWLALDVPRDLQQLVDQPEMASYRAMRAATLTVFAAGYASALLRDVPFAGEQPAAIEVPLAPGDCGELAGFVTRAGGAVADARVQLRPLPPLQWDGGDRMVFATRRSAADGGFEFAAPAGDYIVEVFVEDQCALQQQVAVPASGPVTLDLAACVWVDVFVVDARGAPVAGHNAMVGAGIGQRGIGRTGDDGHVGFGPFPAGRLHARAPRIASETSWAAAVEVEFTAAAGERPEITLRLPSDELVRPVLTFDGPAPADGFAGFTVRQRGGSDTEAVPVGDDGAVPIALLPGEGRLAVDAPGGRTWDFTLPADARDGHVLALRWRGLGYAGIAVDETGTPIAGCQLQATPIGRGPRVTVRTGSDGAFRLDGLEPCEYRLSIPDRPRYSQDKLFPRQLWTPLAPPAT
ncbi:MAG: carboxypeptidase regulatory-like domain-containing protein, partial [Planctomycetes bacterium]|nr:carboxypeptidase regulatory-like domain-containing protein [Planctomycetota bacterium]